MGPRRVAVTQKNPTAKVSGQEAESLRHAASPSERAENPEDGHSWLTELVTNLEEKVSSLESEITMLNLELDECRQVIQEIAGVFGGDGFVDMQHDIEQMSIQIGLLQRAVSNAAIVAHDPDARLQIPEPKAYSAARDAKEVENFLFDMEQYFLAADLQDKARKVSTATMYLTGDAKLWWHTKYAEIQANQFFLENVEYNASRALRKLEHTGSVDMSEKDKLFTFMKGLKPWARIKLQRQQVTALSLAMAVAECLADFNLETRRDRQRTTGPAQNKSGGVRSFKSNSNRGGGEQKPHAQSNSQSSSGRSKSQENRKGAPRRRLPEEIITNALATFTDKASPGKSVEPQTTASGENDSEEDEDAVSQWCSTLSTLEAKKVVPPLARKTVSTLTVKQPEQEVQPRNPWKKGLMFIDVKIHGKPIRAMIDTGASHNYLASAEVARLGLVLEKGE
ncbi:UNVERIFIED_CONTAM: hypothetical protein Sindi_2483900 [Sesamum indicum]